MGTIKPHQRTRNKNLHSPVLNEDDAQKQKISLQLRTELMKSRFPPKSQSLQLKHQKLLILEKDEWRLVNEDVYTLPPKGKTNYKGKNSFTIDSGVGGSS